jgi:hypothetical protein
MSFRNVLALSASLALVVIGSAACSSSPAAADTKKDGGAADGGSTKTASRPKTKPKTASLKAKAGPKPPAGATSTGTQSSPKAGAVTVPITDVEVFTFEEEIAEGSPAQRFDWAYVEGTGTYLWTTGAVTCADGSTDETAAFLMEVKPDGSGTYLFSLPGCPSSDLFGCDFDGEGTETTCGACVVDEAGSLTCAVTS